MTVGLLVRSWGTVHLTHRAATWGGSTAAGLVCVVLSALCYSLLGVMYEVIAAMPLCQHAMPLCQHGMTMMQ